MALTYKRVRPKYASYSPYLVYHRQTPTNEGNDTWHPDLLCLSLPLARVQAPAPLPVGPAAAVSSSASASRLLLLNGYAASVGASAANNAMSDLLVSSAGAYGPLPAVTLIDA